jgi:hypothetical protein
VSLNPLVASPAPKIVTSAVEDGAVVTATVKAVIPASTIETPVGTTKLKLAFSTASCVATPVTRTGVTATDVASADAAFAGTTDRSPNPSEATATADTFFNEIVFTIFLSFSQIKESLLPGW